MTARSTLQIAASHPALAGHFPGRPVVPGVVLLDEVLHRLEAARAGWGATPPDGWQLRSVKFHRVVLPEQILSLDYSRQEDGSIRFELRLADSTLVAAGILERSGDDAAWVGQGTVTPGGSTS